MPLSALLLALLANAAWAFNFIAGKIGVEHFSPLFFTALRFGLLLLILLPFLRIVRGSMGAIMQVAITLGVVHFSLVFIGLSLGDDISPLALATQLYVPFSVLLAVLFLGETLGARRLAAIVVAFAGILVIGLDPVVFSYLSALGFIIAAAMAMAVGTVLMRRLQGVGVFNLQAWIALVAAPVQLGLSWLFEDGQVSALQSADWFELAAPLYSAIGASVVGHGIVYYLLRAYPVSLITPLMLLTPVFAVVFGVWLMDDQLSARIIVGGGLTLAGVALISVDPRRLPKWARL